MAKNPAPAEYAYDPRTRLCFVLCLSSLSIMLNSPLWLAGVFVITLVIAAFFGKGFASSIRFVRWVLYMAVFLLVLQSVFGIGNRVFLQVGGITLLTDYGINAAVLFALRMSVIIISASILLCENSRRMVQAMVQMRLPYEIAFMVSTAIRFMRMLSEEMSNSLLAIQLRGVNLKKIPVRKRVMVYTYLLLPVLSGAIFKARQLSLSLELRGFRLSHQRTSYFRLEMTKKDRLIIAVTILFTVILIVAYFSRGLWL